MQLVAYGAQDVYLTGNPQITFFKVVYRRHTNFSMEAIEQTINGSQAHDGSGTVTISRNGDLVHKVYVTTNAANITNGSALVKSVDLEIGGQLIDRQTAEWMQVVNELNTPESKAIGLKAMQGDVGTSQVVGGTGVGLVQVPLQFYFCRNPGLALPLIALQYHEVKLKCSWGAATCTTRSVFCDYIYLDTDERRRFAQVSHEYLIEQVQVQTASGSSKNTKLNFNHPVKELIWISAATNAYGTAKLTLNGHDRFSAQEEEYFQLRQPVDYHTAVPRQNLPSAAQTSLLDRQITLATPTNNAAAYVVQNLATDATNGVRENGSDAFLSAAGVLTISGAGVLTAAEFAVGQQIAITVLSVQQAGGLSLDILGGNSQTAATTPGIGDIYFATVTVAAAAGAAAGSLAMTISLPTTANTTGKTFTTLTDSVGGNGGTTFTLLRVTNGNSAQARTSQMTKKINCYSFALKPEEHQPSGTCNFSRIDTAHLDYGSTNVTPEVIYAVNYNVLRIMSGMGGLAYSN